MRKNPTAHPILKNKIYRLAIENVPIHVIFTDTKGTILFANKATEIITGYRIKEIVGSNPSLWGGQMDKDFYTNMWNTIKVQKKVFEGEIKNRRKNGEEYIALTKITPISDKSGRLIGFVGIEEDITKLKEVDRMKTEFISLASHQLRTPLTAVRWNLELLLKGRAGKLTGKQNKLTQSTYQSAMNMVDLVNMLLNISRIESGKLEIKPGTVDLKKLIGEIIDELHPLLQEKSIIIELDFDQSIQDIHIDPRLIRQVYINLLTNSIKYSETGKRIYVKIYKDVQNIISEIKDEGIGIPENQKRRVFEKFFRGNNAQKISSGGIGLGLYLIKSIVEMSGGKIWFESVEHKGTIFWFTLPLFGMSEKKGEVQLER